MIERIKAFSWQSKIQKSAIFLMARFYRCIELIADKNLVKIKKT